MAHAHCNDECWLRRPAPFIALGLVIALELALAAALLAIAFWGRW